MIAELGQFILTLSLVLAFCQVWFSYQAATGAGGDVHRVHSERVTLVLAALLFLAFILLVVCFLRSDFSVALVVAHSHSTKSWFFQIAASWGNHEGSLLLWVLLLAVFGAAFAFFERRLDARTKSYTLMVQGVLLVLFLAFLIFTSNPFARLAPLVFQGAGLNPVLQDIALVIHPPILYLGYVGFSLVFSLSVAALLARRVDRQWVAALKVPVLFSWAAMTLGIGLGSWWAYRELGWGGFWFWDPVENASLMPWLVATALLHIVIPAQQKGVALRWVVLLGAFTFLFSILGTFLTRSGLITSVHSFASDPTRGMMILGILLGLLVWVLFLLRRFPKEAEPQAQVDFFSREAGLLANNLFLLSTTLAVLVGTIYPMVLEAFGGARISVGEPYYQASVFPMMSVVVAVMPLVFFFGERLKKNIGWFAPALLASVLLGVVWQPIGSFVAFGFVLALWLIFGALTSAILMKKRVLLSLGQLFAHAGLGIFLLGALGAGAAQQKRIYAFKPQEIISFAGLQVQFIDVQDKQGKDYRAEEGKIIIYQNKTQVAQLFPQVRYYIARNQPTREAAIWTSWFPLADFHAILGDAVAGVRTVQLYYNPLAPLLWLGVLMAALGGGLAMRRRV